MIDIHTHVLPGFDDGPQSLAESLAMLGVAERDGVVQVVATPHSPYLVGAGYDEAQIRASVEALQREAEAHGCAVRVHPGIEVHLVADLEQQSRQGKAFTLAGSRYLLLELPFYLYPPFAEQAVNGLLARGLVPILAHPERLEYFQKDPNQAMRLIESGALAQVTAASVVGSFGVAARLTAQVMLEHGMVHFIASDAHDEVHRAPRLSAARDLAAKWLGEEGARALVVDHPRAVLADVPIVPVEPHRYNPRRRWFPS